MKYLIGIDPSFARTGLSLYDMSSGRLSSYNFPHKVGKLNFVKSIELSLEIVGEVIKAVDRSVVQEKTSDITAHFLAETPPPIGQFSSGLSTLGVVLYLGIKQWGESRHIKGFYSTVSPMYIATIHQTRKYSKSDTVRLAKSLIKTFSDSGYIKSFFTS